MTVPDRPGDPGEAAPTTSVVGSAARPVPRADEIRLLRVGPGGELASDSAFAVALVTLWHRAATAEGRQDGHEHDHGADTAHDSADPAGTAPTRAEVAAAVAPVVDAIRTGRALACALSRGRALIGVGVVRPGEGAAAHTATITALVVDPAETRQGLGTRLLGALTGYAADTGVDRVGVTVPDQPGPVAFFERAGYAVWGRRPGWTRPGTGVSRDELVLGTVLEGAR